MQHTRQGKGHGRKDRQGWVWCRLKLQYHQPLNTSHAQACYRHHEASWARLGSMTVSFEAVPHSPSCGVAQPQSSMKESYPALLLRHDVDRTAQASSASSKSTSLELLLHLHTNVGAVVVRRRNECSCTARARCTIRPPTGRPPAGVVWQGGRQGVGRSSSRTAAASQHSVLFRLSSAPCIAHTRS